MAATPSTTIHIMSNLDFNQDGGDGGGGDGDDNDDDDDDDDDLFISASAVSHHADEQRDSSSRLSMSRICEGNRATRCRSSIQ